MNNSKLPKNAYSLQILNYLHADRGQPDPITIGEDCWLGGNVTVCPGVTIGDRVVIGAGSVVTHDIPSDCLAAGNPCEVIRPLNTETPTQL